MDYEKKALIYHKQLPHGKIEIRYTKPLDTQEDLALAYSPGVAGPCREIADDSSLSYTYTARGNLVAVISNGSAVLGLGNIGPHAAKPVMEGKGMLFKKFAGIDVFDIEVAASNPDDFITAVKTLEPTFGGINLEDIKAPECFYIEEQLKKQLDIPVFHDDQHGTAIITAAAFLNAMELSQRNIETTKIVFSGAGAAAISCAKLLLNLGANPKNLLMCDSKGLITTSRQDLNPFKQQFAQNHPGSSLSDAIAGADAFIGVSMADILSQDMLKSMAPNPIVFALSNPNPEISPQLAHATRSDLILATGRSDLPNQVNNVLGFPYIFRGALDVRAREINEEMKQAAVYAIAALAKEDVPEEVMAVYQSSSQCSFGRDYLIPKPVDSRVLLHVAPAVAQAAILSGVARQKLDIEEYRERLQQTLGPSERLVSSLRKEAKQILHKTKKLAPKITITGGTDIRTIQAAKQMSYSHDARICLLGPPAAILATANKAGIKDLKGIELIDPAQSSWHDDYAAELYELRKRRGISRTMSNLIASDENYFGALMVKRGDTDGLITGINSSYHNALLPILKTIGHNAKHTLAGVYMMVKGSEVYFFADCTINIEPDANTLAEIAISTANIAAQYHTAKPRIGMLSFASFGSSNHEESSKVKKAVEIIKERSPDLEVDGEMQADVALDQDLREREFPFSTLSENANVLVFPNLSAANISYKMLTKLGGFTPIGPILAGLKQPAHVIQRSATVAELVHMIHITARQVLQGEK